MLLTNDVIYTPQVLSQYVYDAILATSNGNGNKGKVTKSGNGKKVEKEIWVEMETVVETAEDKAKKETVGIMATRDKPQAMEPKNVLMAKHIVR